MVNPVRPGGGKNLSALRRIMKRPVRSSSAQPLKLKIANGLGALRELPELTGNEQTVLRRIHRIFTLA